MTNARWFITAVLLALTLTGAKLPTAADDAPSDEQIAFATGVYDLMFKELVAALFTEFDDTTPANVEQGKLAISLIFNDANRDMRLVGIFAPLLGGNNDLPRDAFERTAIELALQGQAYEAVERVGKRWYFRRSFALSNTLHPNCVLCHPNFTNQFFQETNNPGQWVGALIQRVPINTDH
jgi:hypothetical protein